MKSIWHPGCYTEGNHEISQRRLVLRYFKIVTCIYPYNLQLRSASGIDSQTMQLYEQYSVTTVFVCPLYLATIILGSLGTGIVIHAYVTDKATHKAFTFLLTNLAIADLIVCSLFTPLLFCYRVHETAGIIGFTPLCELSLFLSVFSTSLIFLVFPLLAYCRKDAMLLPDHPRFSLERARTVTRVFWVLSILSGAMMVVMARCDLTNNDSVFPYLYRCLMINQSLDLYAQVRKLALI